MYKYIATGSQLPEALAWSTRETASSSNFVCIGADPKAEAARTSAVSKQPTAAEPSPPPSAPSKTPSISAGAPTPTHQGAASAFEITVEWAKPPKPTLPNPSGSADPVRLPSPEPDAVWTLQTQDKTLYHSLSRWAQAAQWQLMWEAERDFPIQAQISIEGSFSAAVQLVMNALSNTDHPLQAVMNEATRVMSIVRHQQRNDS
jgi:hypothetical protein